MAYRLLGALIYSPALNRLSRLTLKRLFLFLIIIYYYTEILAKLFFSRTGSSTGQEATKNKKKTVAEASGIDL